MKFDVTQLSVPQLSLNSILRDCGAGIITALVTIAYCLSFSALIFQGPLSAGLTLGLAALLTGAAIAGFIVSLTTSLTPSNAGPDTPAVAVMSVLAVSMATSLAASGTADQGLGAATHVLIAISISTFLTGLMLMAMGLSHVGQWLRFIPYPVIGGFLAASGWLLITGGIEVMTGVSLSLNPDDLGQFFQNDTWPQLAVGLGFAAFIILLKAKYASVLILPITFFVSLVALNSGLHLFDFGKADHWFLQNVGDVKLWLPLSAVATETIDWSIITAHSIEIFAVCGVTAISMLLDVTSLEVSRNRSVELDQEFRTNGIANLVASMFGGVASNLSLNGSILINEAGGLTRLSGIVSAIICGLVLLFGADLAALIPTPLLGGLLAYVGMVILIQALLNAPALRNAADLALATSIMLVIINAGYLLGVFAGILGACLMFAFNYSRIGVVRRHLTRKDFASNIERSSAQKRFLQENGQKIHVVWLSGYIFFGSSNGLFEYVKHLIEDQSDPRIHHIILDFSSVPGIDSSAMLSLIKLRNHCEANGVALSISGINDEILDSFRNVSYFADGGPHRLFGNRNVAIEACENTLLNSSEIFTQSSELIEDWLERELGEAIGQQELDQYFRRLEVNAGDFLYRQGDPADSVDLVTTGLVAIVAEDGDGGHIQLRRMAGQTVIGEMGFYRKTTRAASVIADEPTIIYRLTRKSFEEMEDADPEMAQAFHKFIIRVLSDRLEFAGREIGALI